jgi:hypothetical protein
MMARPSHPKKEVEAALHHAEECYCPSNLADCRCGEFCITSIWSTPKNPGNHARALLRVVNNCTAHRHLPRADGGAWE